MSRVACAILTLVTLHLIACASTMGEVREDDLPPMPPLPPPDEPAEAAPGAQAPAQATPSAERAPTASQEAKIGAAADSELPPLPTSIDGGEIPRSTLYAVLADGIGHFLRKVRTEPHLAGGRFVGWRLLTVPSEDGVLKSGDTVIRVNGQSIERPEQFKNVWDSMATSSELVLKVRRRGKDSTVRYRIVD